MTDQDLSKRAYKELFWDALEKYPSLRFQLIELIEARTLSELKREWCFHSRPKLINYIRGPLKRRLQKVAGGEAVKHLERALYGNLKKE